MKIKILTSLCVLGLFQFSSSFAYESNIIKNKNGDEIFDIRFYAPGEGAYMNDPSSKLTSDWTLNELQKKKVIDGVMYWQNILSSHIPVRPIVLNIGTSKMPDNAFAYGPFIRYDKLPGREFFGVESMLLGGDHQPTAEGCYADGSIGLGIYDYYSDIDIPGSIIKSNQTSLTSMVVHEFAHLLGIVRDSRVDNSTTFRVFFNDNISNFTSQLYDAKGKQAQPGMEIILRGTEEQAVQGFDFRENKAYFLGEHVREVLANAIAKGSMKGIPINGSMDHIELEQSMMSHQEYRNYAIFMEAELALIQDLGYAIDRKNMFGHSIYESDSEIINRNGYFQRNNAGTDYLIGETNTAYQGVGLHVYGKGNTITQQADLLAGGTGATGIRIDGEKNNLTIDKGVRIHANGDYGTGLLVAYGKEHQINHSGSIRALGEEGIAVQFDFGNNFLGGSGEQRGSYMQKIREYSLNEEDEIVSELKPVNLDKLLDVLKGALVKEFNVRGEVSGSKAAIYIADNALVDTINILPGAQLQGDIISEYNQRDEHGQQRLTVLNFGQVVNRNTDSLDNRLFFLEYSGNIQGENNFVVQANQGTVSLNGQHNVYGMDVAQNATLMGDSTFTTNELINKGTLALLKPSNQVNVKQRYEQSDTGTLQLAFSHQQSSQLTIYGDVNIDAGGKLKMVAEKGWYGHNWSLNLEELIKVYDSAKTLTAKTVGELFNLANITIDNSSPIVSFNLVNDAEGLRAVSTRATDAYRRYALTDNAYQLAGTLDQIGRSGQLQSDLQGIYVALDDQISEPDTFNRSLAQLSPNTYVPMFRAALERERHLNSVLSELPTVNLVPGSWQGFANLVGAKHKQNIRQQQVGFSANYSGVLIGAQTTSEVVMGLTYGIHSVISHQKINVKELNGSKGQSNHFGVGVQSYYSPPAVERFYTAGLARIGIEKKHFDRNVDFSGYQQSHSAKWRGYTGSVMAEVGYRYSLNQSVELTPFANLDYTIVKHAGFTEEGVDASRLRVKQQHKNSLVSQLGAKGSTRHEFRANTALTGILQVSWRHQLLSTDLVQTANFTGYTAQPFTQKSELGGRNAMGIKGGVIYELNPKTSVGLQMESSLFRSGYHTLDGNLSISHRF